MEIIKNNNNGTMIIKLVGRLDTNTAPQLETELSELYDSISDLTLDLVNLEYISSAGLRVLLTATKKMKDHFCLTNVNKEVYDVLEMTGFTSIITIK